MGNLSSINFIDGVPDVESPAEQITRLRAEVKRLQKLLRYCEPWLWSPPEASQRGRKNLELLRGAITEALRGGEG